MNKDKGTAKRQWEEMEKASRISWIILSFLIAVGMIIICIWQGATKKEPVSTNASVLEVLPLEEAYEKNQEITEIFQALTPEELAGDPFLTNYEAEDKETLLPVYQCNLQKPQKDIMEQERKLPLEYSGAKGVSQGFEEKEKDIEDYLRRMYQKEFFEGEIQAAFTGTGLDEELKSNYQVSFYPQGTNVEETLLNYSMKRVVIDIQEDGKIIAVHKDAEYDFVKIGDYPIIGENMARQLLDEGRYFTNVPGDYPGEESIVMCEILYRNDGSSLKIPYYRFLIELPKTESEEDTPGDLTKYGAYYVPAIDGKFLDNLSLWHEIVEDQTL